ncbi:unnamed protein product [Didymodactylos carnosus]|uniref:Reverse transcriptase domain-containing protein n=1 Tax=Didymodactylos carnosus TaxID=1234261 RepID=A0A816DS05_9BILA|nr:unnamed protein product [Didymodactylos carnosus]CAF4556354.1 unnamed protein product [Didymodactylos carnosus]
MGLPKKYLESINQWLGGKRAFIEIKDCRSKWCSILRGGPQGSCFTPTLFICYHADMGEFLQFCASFFFADDLAAVLAGGIGEKYTKQCIDLERRMKLFLDNLAYYALLNVQPINWSKTEALWSARARGVYGNAQFVIKCGDKKDETREIEGKMSGEITVSWVKEFKEALQVNGIMKG